MSYKDDGFRELEQIENELARPTINKFNELIENISATSIGQAFMESFDGRRLIEARDELITLLNRVRQAIESFDPNNISRDDARFSQFHEMIETQGVYRDYDSTVERLNALMKKYEDSQNQENTQQQ